MTSRKPIDDNTQPLQHPERLVIISGPSGAGKSTVVRKLLESCPLEIELSVSATTRKPRSGERDGIDYHFLTHEAFQSRRAAGDFLECMEVFGRGDWYGTLNETVSTGLAAGKWVVLEIDVEGALSVIDRYPKTITIFIHCGSVDELERRLRNRGTETESAIARRLEVARREMELASRYRYMVVNRDADEAAHEICGILSTNGEDQTCMTN